MGRVLVFRWSATPNPRGRCPSTLQVLAFVSIYAYTVCRTTTKIDVVTHTGRDLFLEIQPRPQLKWTGSQRSQFLRFLSIYAYILCRRTTKFDVVKHVGEGCVSWGQPRLPSQDSWVPALPIFWILMYLCLHPLTQNNQIRHGNTYGEGRVFRRSATSLLLYKCVARFVSDSWVSCIFNNFVKSQPIVILFGAQHPEESWRRKKKQTFP